MVLGEVVVVLVGRQRDRAQVGARAHRPLLGSLDPRPALARYKQGLLC